VILDLHLGRIEKPFRRAQRAPRYYDDIRVSIPGLPVSPEEARADAEREAKEKATTQRTQQQPPPQHQQTTQPKTQRMDQAVRDDRAAAERRDGGEQHQQNQALKEASGQGVQELRHSEFVENLPQQQVHTGAAFRAPSSGASVLQNIRALTSEGHPERMGAPGQEGNANNFLRGDTNRPQTGVRLGDIARYAGVQEGAHLPPGAWANPQAARWAGNRAGLPSQAFTPESPFSRLSDQAFTRTWSAASLTNLLNQAAQNLAESHPALMDRSFPAAAVLHGGLLFVRDGDRLRAFRLLEDGTLHEAGGEHQGHPLSQEARAEMARVLKQKGIHARLSGEKEALVDEKHLDSKMMQRMGQKDHSLSARGEFRTLFRDDSNFAHLLREVLEEGKDVGEYLGEGENAQFAEKGDWPGFFSRMLGLGSSEKPTKKTLDEILGFIYRGLFKKKDEQGGTLVSDIKYKNPGLQKEDKFARIGINEELLEALKNLKPGETISKELLEKHLGEEISFLQLLHVIQKSDPALASEILRNVKFDPMANVDPYSQARVEHHIFSQARKRAQEQAAQQTAQNANVFGNVYDLQEKQKRDVTGKPKLYTFLVYSVIVVAIALTLYFLITKS
jgi:hypothetical protein